MHGISGLDKPAVQWTFVACGVVLIAVCTGAGVALVRTRTSMDEVRREALQARIDREQVEASLARERSAREAFALQLGRERQANAPPTVPTLTLAPVKTKSPRGPEIAVPQTSAPVVELRLVLPRGAAADRPFTITLRSWTTGDVLWVRSGLHAGTADGRPAVVAPITSDVFVPGQYEILLTMGAPATDVATYEVAILPSGAPK